MRKTPKTLSNPSRTGVLNHHQVQSVGLVENHQAWSVMRGWQFVTMTLMVTLLSVTMAGLSGCGFHLRGLESMGDIQFKTVKLQTTSGLRPEMLQAIRSQLTQSGVKLVDSLAAAELEIVLRPTVYKASRTAYSDSGDTTAEFLRMEQSFAATWVDTEESVVTGNVQTYRDRQIDTRFMLAANRELRSIHREMAENLARKIMRRINRAILQASTKVSEESGTKDKTVETLKPTNLPKSAD
jgi:LPS-assembly lipoprotein